MMDANVMRGLRAGGLITLVFVAALVIAEGAVLEWGVASAPVQADIVNRSSLREAAVRAVLVGAKQIAIGGETIADFDRAVEELRSRQASFADLSPIDAARFGRFITAARALESNPRNTLLLHEVQRDGPRLYDLFDTSARRYAERRYGSWLSLRDLVIVCTLAILIVLVVSYLTFARRRDAYTIRLLQKLEARRQRFAALFEHSSEMMALYDVTGHIIRANATALATLGFGQGLVGRPYNTHVKESDRATVDAAFARARSGIAQELAVTFLDAHGHEMPVMASLSPIVVESHVVGIVGAARDMTRIRLAEAALLHSREQFRSLFEQNPTAICAVATDGMITATNTSMERLTGYVRRELVGQRVLKLVSPLRREAGIARSAEVLKGKNMTFETLIACKDESEFLAVVESIPIFVAGVLEGTFMQIKDVTRERALGRSVNENDERMKALYRLVSSKDDEAGVLIDQALFFGCTELRMAFGYVAQGSRGKLIVQHRHGSGDIIPVGSRMPITTAIGERISATPGAVAIDDLAAETGGDELNVRGLPWKSFVGIRIAIDGVPYGALLFMDAHVREKPVSRAELDFVVLLGSIVETAVAREARLAHIKATQLELEHEARTDHLTGIANRRQFSYLAEIEIDRAIRDRRDVSVLLLDIDIFKQINDNYGHKTGDQVLRHLAELCSRTLRESDIVGRIGGEEFALLLPETDMGQALELAERLRRAIAADALHLESNETVHITVSIGVSTLCADVRTIEGLLAAADVALYEAKNSGRNAVRTARQTVP